MRDNDSGELWHASAQPESSSGLTRREIAKIGAWAVPAVLVVGATPLAAASVTPYRGPAFQVINAGAGATNDIKLYGPGDGPLRGTATSLQAGARFGSIDQATGTRTATIEFRTTLAPGPSATSLFTTFGSVAVSGQVPIPGGFRYTLTIGATSVDPRISYNGVNSITVNIGSSAIGAYIVTDSNAKTGAFSINATSGATATTLALQPTY